ncbi:unnamed protein product [Dimorphilus gyrociliatus]|uniref:Uncharacterized protein n=1 Tax=Dimorphilus gyrociliatus TaxID=2664684 RepID=A0A7I8WBA2_9ANNE|nr:unnamed protein product [Dimorphilus gyrociliatus]
MTSKITIHILEFFGLKKRKEKINKEHQKSNSILRNGSLAAKTFSNGTETTLNIQTTLGNLQTTLTKNCNKLDGIEKTLKEIHEEMDNCLLDESKLKTDQLLLRRVSNHHKGTEERPIISTLARKDKINKALLRCHKELDGLARTHFDLQLRLQKTESQERLVVDDLNELEFRIDCYT